MSPEASATNAATTVSDEHLRATLNGSFDKYERLGAYHWQAIEAGTPSALLRRSLALFTRYEAVRRAIPRDAKRVVEVGCGDGALSHILANGGTREVLGCDTDTRGIELAREQLRDRVTSRAVRFECRRFEDCGVPPCSVDAVVLADVIEHLPDPLPLLEAIRRSLRPRGCLVVTTPRARPGMLPWDPRHCIEFNERTLAGLLRTVFPRVSVRPFMPIVVNKIYSTHAAVRAAFNLAAAAGVNPMAIRWRGADHVMLRALARS